MTRMITAQQVKPGMKIKFERNGWEYAADVHLVGGVDDPSMDSVLVWAKVKSGVCGDVEAIDKRETVTVLEEAQPDEPKKPGSLVVVEGAQFIRCDNSDLSWRQVDAGRWFFWDDLRAMGQIRVVSANPLWA